MRSQPKSPPERTPFSFLIRPAGMPRKPWWFRATSRSCRCRRVHPSSTARKTSGNSCARIGYQTGSLNPSTISSTTAATPGTHSSINPGRSCPSRDATGQQSVTQSEDWYYGPRPGRHLPLHFQETLLESAPHERDAWDVVRARDVVNIVISTYL